MGGAVGGSVAEWYKNGKQKRDILGTHLVPRVKMTARDDVGSCNVPQYNFDQCHNEVSAATVKVTSSIPSDGVAQFDNVPAACMDLVSVLAGSCTGGGINPVVCGSACIHYSGLTDTQMTSLGQTLVES